MLITAFCLYQSLNWHNCELKIRYFRYFRSSISVFSIRLIIIENIDAQMEHVLRSWDGKKTIEGDLTYVLTLRTYVYISMVANFHTIKYRTPDAVVGDATWSHPAVHSRSILNRFDRSQAEMISSRSRHGTERNSVHVHVSDSRCLI